PRVPRGTRGRRARVPRRPPRRRRQAPGPERADGRLGTDWLVRANAEREGATVSTQQKLRKRYERFHISHEPGEAAGKCVTAFLASIESRGSQRNAYSALRNYVPAEWSRVPRPKYHRDETRLRATVLRRDERERLAELSIRERALFYVLYVVRREE